MIVQRIPVTVIGGYLGAGKTTLVNHVLRASSERVAVIVNDFGEISIDEDLIAAADGDKLTLANGCICCSLADGFAAALGTVRSTEPPPDRLLIEASGVADPAQIAAYGHTPGLRLDAVVVMADAEQVQRQANDRWVADTVRMQLAAADLLVVNKVDLLGNADDVEALCDWLAGLAGRAAVVRVSRAAVPIEVLFGPRADGGETDVSVGHTGAATTPHAEDLFDSQTVELDAPVPLQLIESLLADLPGGVARLKGLVQVMPPDGASVEVADYLVEAVGPRTSTTPHTSELGGPPRNWSISLISYRGSVPPEWLHNRLNAPA